jgi:hypothetical protein
MNFSPQNERKYSAQKRREKRDSCDFRVKFMKFFTSARHLPAVIDHALAEDRRPKRGNLIHNSLFAEEHLSLK